MNTSTESLEQSLERERASLASTIDKLTDRVSVDHVAREALETIKSNAASVTQTVDGIVRSNPAAVALTGVGLAWLLFGNRSKTSAPATEDRWQRLRDEQARVQDRTLYSAYASPADEEWAIEAERIRRSASASLDSLEQEERSTIGQAYDKARDFAAEKAEVIAKFTSDLKTTFQHGLDDLSDQARTTVVDMRQRAYHARIAAERKAKGAKHEAARLFDENPLVAGAAALAAGAALAALLPRTKTEDGAFGEQSDRLMREATALLHQERARAERVAKGVGDELKSAVKDMGDTLTHEVADTAKAVKERAKSEAQTGDTVTANGATIAH